MSEERLIYIALVVVGGISATAEIVTSHDVSAWATAALLMLLAGTLGLVQSWLHRPRLPKAWIRR